MGGRNGGRGERRSGAGIRHLQGQRAVVEQHLLLRLQGHAKVLAQQHRRQARAVDKKIARDVAVAAGLQGGDVPVLMCEHGGDFVRNVPHAQLFDGVPTQQQAHLDRVEVVAVIGHGGKFGGARLLGPQARVAQMRLGADGFGKGLAGVAGQPAANEIGIPIALRQREGMVVAVVFAPVHPAIKARALLERGITPAHQFGLVQADAAQGFTHRWPGAFAHADGRGIRRFDQGDRQRAGLIASVFGGQQGSRQPACRATAQHHNPSH